MQEKEYIKLPGRGLRRGSSSLLIRTRASLWMGNDHLLCVYNTGYTEEYRRFYYRDIRAIVSGKTSRGKIINAVFAMSASIPAILSVNAGGIPLVIFLSLTSLFSLLLVINWLRGPTCICRLYTAVSREELPSLNRARKASEAIERLRHEIENAQGRLTAEEIAMYDEKMAANVFTPRAKPASTGASHHGFYDGRIHGVLFYLLLINAAISAAKVFLNYNVLTPLSMVTGWTLAVFAIMALIRQHGSSMKSGIRGVTWMAIVYVCVSYVAGYVIFLFLAMKNLPARRNQWEMIRIFSHLSPRDFPLLMAFDIFSLVVSFAAGITGILLLRKYRQAAIVRDRPLRGEA